MSMVEGTAQSWMHCRMCLLARPRGRYTSKCSIEYIMTAQQGTLCQKAINLHMRTPSDLSISLSLLLILRVASKLRPRSLRGWRRGRHIILGRRRRCLRLPRGTSTRRSTSIATTAAVALVLLRAVLLLLLLLLPRSRSSSSTTSTTTVAVLQPGCRASCRWARVVAAVVSASSTTSTIVPAVVATTILEPRSRRTSRLGA